jgi:plastocyanin
MGRRGETVALKQKLLVFGFLAAIPIVPMLVLGTLILTTQESRMPPSVITGLVATNVSHDRHGQVDLAWIPSDADDFAYYSVYAAETEITDVSGLSPVSQIYDRADATYQVTRYNKDSGLQVALFAFLKDTDYWFAVTAVDAAGNESEVEISASATIEKMPPAPSVFITLGSTGSRSQALTYLTYFVPETVTIPIGTTVAWTNISPSIRLILPGTNHHTVTSDTGLFNGDFTSVSDTLNYTFYEAGVFSYHCEAHPSEIGTIVVDTLKAQIIADAQN